MQVDRIGMGLSAVCAVHCAAMPLLAGFSSLLHNPAVEGGMVGMAALIGFGTLGSTVRHHRRAAPLAVFTFGILILAAAHSAVPEAWEAATSISGACLMLGAQLLNRRVSAPGCSCPRH